MAYYHAAQRTKINLMKLKTEAATAAGGLGIRNCEDNAITNKQNNRKHVEVKLKY